MPILLSFVYHLQKNMIISPIELCDPSVADPEWAAPSLQHPPPKKKKSLEFGLLYAPESTILSLRFWHFSGAAWPRTPVKHIRGWLCQPWCVLEIIVNKLASIAESITAYPNEMSANAYFMPRAMSIFVLQAHVFIRGVVVLDVRWVVPNC